MPQDDRHLTTEQCSAFLDQQLSPTEMVTCRTHLASCEQCQHVLAELQQTVSLLRALPPPVLPRSFMLPATTEIVPSSVRETQASAKGIATSRSTHRRLSTLRYGMQFVSALAAVVGVIFVLSGLLLTLENHSAGMTSATSYSSANGTSAKPTLQNATSTSKATTSVPLVRPLSPKLARTPSVQPSNEAVNKIKQIVPVVLLFDLSTASGRLGLGILLALAGMAGFTLFAQRKKREARR